MPPSALSSKCFRFEGLIRRVATFGLTSSRVKWSTVSYQHKPPLGTSTAYPATTLITYLSSLSSDSTIDTPVERFVTATFVARKSTILGTPSS